MPDVRAYQFGDEVGVSRYPFEDTASLLTTDGLSLHPNTFVDAVYYVINGQIGAGLASVEVATDVIRFWIGDQNNPRRASGIFDPVSPSEKVVLRDANARDAGLLICDPTRLAALQTWSVGVHKLVPNGGRFVASCVMPSPEIPVRALKDANGRLVSGTVALVGDRGVILSAVEGGVRVDVVGDPYAPRRDCASSDTYDPPRMLRTISGVGPDSTGAFQLVAIDPMGGQTALRIYTIETGKLKIEMAGRISEVG